MRKLLTILPVVALAAAATPSAYAAGYDSAKEYENCVSRAIRAQAFCLNDAGFDDGDPRVVGMPRGASNCIVQFDRDKAQCDRERAWADGDRGRDWRREID